MIVALLHARGWYDYGLEKSYSRKQLRRMLEAAGVAPTLAEPEEVLEAIYAPPEGTPATLRGQTIRKFAQARGVRASWHTVLIDDGHGKRVVRLT